MNRLRYGILCLCVVLLSAGCGDSGKAEAAAACRTMDPGAMSHSDYVCALAGEMKSIANALATVEDKASADLAVPILKKHSTRIAAVVKQRDRLNSQTDTGLKGATASKNMPKLTVATLAFMTQSQRIAREHPDLWVVIGPAIEGIDIN